MKRVLLPAVALCALAIAVPAAETAPTSDTGCTVEHVSNAECQGPDADPAANICEINTWVDNASCEVTVADGAATNVTGFAFAYPVLDASNNWHAEFDLVIRDKGTGQVLYSENGSLTRPVTEHPEEPFPPAATNYASTFAQEGGSEVVCEITGTHSPAGAGASAAAATTGFGQWNNRFRCNVN
jgi:hypothetical protein